MSGCPGRYEWGGPSAKRPISAIWASSSVGKATDWRVGSAMSLSSRLQERPLLELLERLPELLLGVHDDGAVPCHGLLERLPRNQEEPDPVIPSLHRDLVALVEEHERAVVRLLRRLRVRPSHPFGRYGQGARRVAELPCPGEHV